MLHNLVVTMGVYADVRIMGEAEIHDAAEDAVSIWITGNSMDYMIRLNIIYPLAFIDSGIHVRQPCFSDNPPHVPTA